MPPVAKKNSHSSRELDLYDYAFPPGLIAVKPATPRDSARLLVLDRNSGKLRHDSFANIGEYLPAGAVLVCNETKVIPARLMLKKETGGAVRVLYIARKRESIEVLADRSLEVGAKLQLSEKKYFEVAAKEGGHYFLKPLFPLKNIYQFLEKYGETPLPPYIKNSPLTKSKIKSEYQSVFARRAGSVAAPTASLHFTKGLLASLRRQGIPVVNITLHVNLGTFASVTPEQIKNKKLHTEYFEIDPKTAEFLNRARREGRPIVAVGTTVVRALESSSRASPPAGGGARGGGRKNSAKLTNLSGETDIFIQPGYRFKFVDALITNFHVPRSSLLMLVSAFSGREKILAAYRAAIAKKYRLFSFGDAMLIK